MRDFEIQKKTLSTSGERRTVGVKLPGELKELFRNIRKIDIKQALDEKLKDKVKVVGDKLRIDVSIFKRFHIYIDIVKYKHYQENKAMVMWNTSGNYCF
jgi:hypothetical protein